MAGWGLALDGNDAWVGKDGVACDDKDCVGSWRDGGWDKVSTSSFKVT